MDDWPPRTARRTARYSRREPGPTTGWGHACTHRRWIPQCGHVPRQNSCSGALPSLAPLPSLRRARASGARPRRARAVCVRRRLAAPFLSSA
eukprot:6098779-Prymnesium_polylepis.1